MIVLVHGAPETPAVWDPLRAALGRDDVVTPQLPGFGRPLPDGFEPTMEACAAWLAAELDALDGPVDLVAHDWGALLSVRVLADRPASVRSWALDTGNLDDDHRWHDMARIWQTPGDGEAAMDQMGEMSNEERAAGLTMAGVPAEAAEAMASHVDQTMRDTMLVLYRSAIHIGREWGPGIDRIQGPGLVVDAPGDPYTSPGNVAAFVERTGAARAELDGCGHWWMLEAPDRAAAALEAFWADL